MSKYRAITTTYKTVYRIEKKGWIFWHYKGCFSCNADEDMETKMSEEIDGWTKADKIVSIFND